MAIHGLAQVAITVADVPAVLSYYRDVMGLPFLFAPNDDLAFLQAGDVRIMLTQPQGEGESGHNSVLYFSVDQLHETYAEIVARGGIAERQPALAAKMPDHELWIGFLRDPEHNLIGLMQEVR